MPIKAYVEKRYTMEQQKIVEEIIACEKYALDKYFKGDMSGYFEIWSHDNFSYFDAGTKERADTYEEIADHLNAVVAGKMYAESYDYHFPRVQLSEDTAVLTYQLHADTSLIEMHYNVIEVFQKNKQNDWKVIHSTWDLITPFSQDIKKPKIIV